MEAAARQANAHDFIMGFPQVNTHPSSPLTSNPLFPATLFPNTHDYLSISNYLLHFSSYFSSFLSISSFISKFIFYQCVCLFPQGYDTDVGSNGVAMSGGQKQRIAIARALVKRPAVLLLDEATSALDAASERVVQQSIDALSRSHAQTTIVIAHRLSTIRSADKIAVVSEGLIAELGTHQDLIARNGLYADLVRLQVNSIRPP